MRNESEILRAAWSRTPACLEVSVLLDSIERGDETVLAHVQSCARCSAELHLYRDITASPASPRAAVRALDRRLAERPEGARTWWSQLFRPAFLAPAMAAAAVLLVVLGTNPQRPTRPAAYESVERAQSLELLSPKGEVAAPPDVLRWSGVPAALSYRIRILEVDRNMIWETAAKTTTASIPAPVQKQMLPGKRLIWTVEAINSDGKVLASGTQDFTRALARKRAH